MKRPCDCGRATVGGKRFTPGECDFCWLYLNDERYRKRWTEPADKHENKPIGPGTALKRLLSELGIVETVDCGCGGKVSQMNRWGIDGCQERFDEIRGWLAEAQGKAAWFDLARAAASAITSGLTVQIDPRDVPGSLVRMAIERAERV